MTIVEHPCARCSELIQLTQTSSLYQADGTPYAVYCATCYEYLKNPNNWKPTNDTNTP